MMKMAVASSWIYTAITEQIKSIDSELSEEFSNSDVTKKLWKNTGEKI